MSTPPIAPAEWLRQRHLVDGVDVPGIAAELGVRESSVRRTMDREGIPWRRRRVRLDDEEWLWRRFVDEGATVAAMAGEAGATPKGIYRALARAGIDLADRGRAMAAGGAALPIGPVLERSPAVGGLAPLARRAGYEPRSLLRWREAGHLPPAAADRLAVALGMHPLSLWPEEWPAVLESQWRGDRSRGSRTVAS